MQDEMKKVEAEFEVLEPLSRVVDEEQVCVTGFYPQDDSGQLNFGSCLDSNVNGDRSLPHVVLSFQLSQSLSSLQTRIARS